ncbi:MAG: mechanosensitive ion channel family protein [Luteibaculaceae bacterium]
MTHPIEFLRTYYREKLTRNRNRIILFALVFIALMLLQVKELQQVLGFTAVSALWTKLIHYATLGVSAELIKFFLVRFYLLRNKREGKTHGNAVSLGLNLITRVFYITLVVLSILAINGISPKDVFTSLSIVAAGIALVTKDYIGGMLNAMIMTFTNQLSIGDQVKIGEIKGKVINVTLSNVQVLSDEDDLIFIPNIIAYNTNIINYTRRAIRKLSLDFEVMLPIPVTVDYLEEFLKATAIEHGQAHNPSDINLKTMQVKKDYVEFRFQLVLDDSLSWEEEKHIRKKIIRALVDQLGSKFSLKA